VETERHCARFKWAFGFKKGVQSLAKKDVYGCKEIVGQELESTFAKIKDYTLIRLDKKVLDRTPLEYRTKGKAKIGDPLIVIGHPSGLPLKISNGAKVSRMNWRELSIFFSTLFRKRYYFLANLDTYAGNSGSPVFNQETGLVEGLLIEGGDDFIMDKERGCSVSNRKSNSRWTTEEMVYRITEIPEIQEKD
jgi:V8-like Glu-specific endopeptidase